MNYEAILELVFKNKCADTKAKYTSVWQDFVEAYGALMSVDDNCDQSALNAQAENVQNLAIQFGKNFAKTLPSKAAGLYFHIFVAHIGRMIKQFGNLSKWSQQGLEHLHRWHKRQRREVGRSVTAGRDCMQADIILRLLKSERNRNAAKAIDEYKKKLAAIPEVILDDSDLEEEPADDEDNDVDRAAVVMIDVL